MPKKEPRQPGTLQTLLDLISVAFDELRGRLSNDLPAENLSSASFIDDSARCGSFLGEASAPTAAILLELIGEWAAGSEFRALHDLVLEHSLAKKFLEGGSYPSDPAGKMDVPATLRLRVVNLFREFFVWCHLHEENANTRSAQVQFFQEYLVPKLKFGLVPTVELFPVINFAVPAGPQRIANNLILRPVRESDAEATFQELDYLGRDDQEDITDTQLALRNWGRQLRVAGKLAGAIFEIYRSAKVGDAPQHRDNLVAASILALDQYPSLPIESATNCDDASYRTVSRAGSLVPFPLPPRVILGAVEFARLTHLWPKLLEASAGNSRVSIALRRLAVLFDRRTNEDRFIDAWIALEALFGSGNEVRFRISQRIAYFLEPAGDARLDLFQRLVKLYDKRSSLVHGSLKQIQPNILEELYLVLPRALFRVIVSCGVAFDPNTLDEDLLRAK
ncbi:MAG: HEPN domain-containing protein [Candidatus Eremiobacteraeota bacterium]|nr:HEPN domain-containing protein [Candidatus Eremiobacteraeota bacterium]